MDLHHLLLAGLPAHSVVSPIGDKTRCGRFVRDGPEADSCAATNYGSPLSRACAIDTTCFRSLDQPASSAVVLYCIAVRGFHGSQSRSGNVAPRDRKSTR